LGPAFRVQKSKVVKYHCEQTSTTSADKDNDDAARQPESAGAPLGCPATEYCAGPHPSRRPLAVYCRDCDEAMCETCFIQLHNGHRHANVDDVAVELRELLKGDADKLASVALEHAERLNVMQV